MNAKLVDIYDTCVCVIVKYNFCNLIANKREYIDRYVLK